MLALLNLDILLEVENLIYESERDALARALAGASEPGMRP
jgi:hypothetical protein